MIQKSRSYGDIVEGVQDTDARALNTTNMPVNDARDAASILDEMLDRDEERDEE